MRSETFSNINQDAYIIDATLAKTNEILDNTDLRWVRPRSRKRKKKRIQARKPKARKPLLYKNIAIFPF